MFVEKLNKKQEGVYVIEEEKDITDGKWEGYLDHDNANRESIVIYTGPNFTGEKVDNFFISTPSETPWKTHLKVFSNSEKIYITYESQGDQVEAEDINLVQDEIVNEIERAILEEIRIDTKLDNEIVRAITEDEKLSEDVADLKEKKADKVYVDTELNKVYKKDEVFTKEEVLQKIEEIIDAAPEALDTLGKLAEALDNDPNFATNILNLLSAKVDKVAGKGLSTNDFTDLLKSKLDGMEEGANKYIHPSTHPASVIVETSSKRFVSDVEKANWNDANSKKHTHSNKSILDKITQALIDSWNSAVEHIGDGIRHITSAERTKWNAKAEKADIPTKVGQLENDKNYVTQSELGNAGYGDMMKSTYDKNDDGIVDKAESVPWSGVTGKPSTFPPSSHNHDGLYEPKNSNIQSHISNKSNPHSTTKSDVGLGNVLDYGIATQAIAETGVSNSYYMTPLRVKQAIEKNAMSKGPLTWNELKGV